MPFAIRKEGLDSGTPLLTGVAAIAPPAPQFDLAKESDNQLIARLASPNVYFREGAQRILTESA
jgi:hypothetical protein